MDFFKEIKVRISSPLISSFLIAWLAINWRIPVALMFYKQVELKADGYASYFNLISVIPVNRAFVLPLIVALFYTFCFPVIRNCIHAYNSWSNRWGANWTFKISKTAAISMENFYDMKGELDERSKMVNDALLESKKLAKDSNALVVENRELESAKMQLEDRLQKAYKDFEDKKAIDDNRRMAGRYDMKYLKAGKAVQEEVGFYGDILMGRDVQGQQVQLFKILHLAFNENNNEFIFLMENLMEKQHTQFPIVFRMSNPPEINLLSVDRNSTIFELRKVGD